MWLKQPYIHLQRLISQSIPNSQASNNQLLCMGPGCAPIAVSRLPSAQKSGPEFMVVENADIFPDSHQGVDIPAALRAHHPVEQLAHWSPPGIAPS